MRKSFTIVIPSYNNERWCRRNLASVLEQQYPHFRVIYIDDASKDETAQRVSETLAASPHAHRVTFLRNDERQGAAANIDRAVRSCDPNDVVLLVDGDDFLAHPRVLERLNTIYGDPDVWVTWGQFERYPQGGEGFCAPIPKDIVSANAYRDHLFVSSHLRTFYARLYHLIRVEDLQDTYGRFFTMAGDVAHMFALLELAGPHARFVAEVLYRYNRENPLNDDKRDRAAQVRTEMEIRGKARYGRVRHLHASRPREVCFGTGVGRSLFERTGPFPDADERRHPFRQLRSVLNHLGYTVREAQTFHDVKDPHAIICFDVRPEEQAQLAAYPPERLALVLWRDPIACPENYEPRYHRPFGRVYTWQNDLVDDARYFKLHFPSLRPMIDDVVAFEKRKLCTLIASNRQSDHRDELYSAERRAAQAFTHADPDSMDVFGWGWDSSTVPGYRTVVVRRVDYLRRYRFSLCYETVQGWNGFVSHKIFDSFAAGCVPVYWGAPDIAQSIPSSCYIRRDEFGSDDELREFLQDIRQDQFEGYLSNIRTFLSSAAALPYRAEHFVRTFVDLIVGRAGHRRQRDSLSDSRNSRSPGSGSMIVGATL